MAEKVALERHTISQAEAAESSQLFVVNKSNPRGNINFIVVDGAQQKVSVQVPVTFIPVDLTTFATKGDVLRNPNFRRLVARGFLHIVSTDSAEKFLEEPRAAAEHARIFDVLRDDSAMDDFKAPISETLNATPPKTEGEVNQFVQSIVLRAVNEDVNALINELEAKLDTLNANDIQYLMDNSQSEEIRNWCVEAMGAVQ